jgi:hypothetical protein
MNKSHTILIAIVAFLAASPASAQGGSLLNPRASILPYGQTQEFSLMFGSLLGSRRDNLSLSYGRFWSPRVQVGTVIGLRGDGFSSVSTAGLFADYHFRPSEPTGGRLVPYVGAFGGYGTPGGRSGAAVGVQGGVKYFPARPVAIRAEIQHRSGFTGKTDTGLVLGISTFLR